MFLPLSPQMKACKMPAASLIFLLLMSLYSQARLLPNEMGRYENLKDFAFTAHFMEVQPGLRMHYLDEGPKDAPTVFLLHGEPYWSYGFRNIMPLLVDVGYRVIAPDMIGFGKSDKFAESDAYTYSKQCEWIGFLIAELELKNIHLFAHDWGAMIMLRIVAEFPELFSHVAVSYGFLFEGAKAMPDSFINWVNFARDNPDFDPGTIMNWGTHRELEPEIIAAYNAPFSTPDHLLALRHFPSLIPTDPADPEAIKNRHLNAKLRRFTKPFLTIWGDHPDTLWSGIDKQLQDNIPGAKNQNHQTLHSSHFVVEDQPEALAKSLIEFFGYQKNHPSGM
jgi:haloalkane dehalogenase